VIDPYTPDVLPLDLQYRRLDRPTEKHVMTEQKELIKQDRQDQMKQNTNGEKYSRLEEGENMWKEKRRME